MLSVKCWCHMQPQLSSIRHGGRHQMLPFSPRNCLAESYSVKPMAVDGTTCGVQSSALHSHWVRVADAVSRMDQLCWNAAAGGDGRHRTTQRQRC
jgi:hypothetical protein